ncbi:MAG: hypothetical protein GY815_17405 [Gammaproteobacteria bacterium]|nr:hypothetical protein [Gammaproteobacteria bacterium]
MIAPAQAWDWLRRELDNWGDAGLQARFWWRDDDAVKASQRLERLLRQGRQYAAPLALAVIPARLETGLGDYLQAHAHSCVLQHGYAHDSHAPPGVRKLELGGMRATTDIVADLTRGYQILQQNFAARFTPVLVPPWNRIDERVLGHLPAIGISGISTMKVRRMANPSPHLLQVNTHLDPVHWRHKGGFIGIYPAIAILVQHLIARRLGYRDFDEPTGILTHHLVQDEAVWRFLENLLAFLQEHPAAAWIDAPTIWKTPD